MAAQTQTSGWRERRRRCRRLVSLCQSRSWPGRGRRVHRQEGRHVSSEIPARSHSARAEGLPVSWLLSSEGELSGFRVADICFPFRLEAVSAAHQSVRVTARCGRPSAVPSVAVPQFHVGSTRVCDQMPPVLRLRELPLQWRRATHTFSAALRPGTAAVVKILAGLECEFSGFRSNAWVCKFHAADHSVNACAVSSRGFGSAAGFCMFQLWVQEGAAASALATSHPDCCRVFSERW